MSYRDEILFEIDENLIRNHEREQEKWLRGIQATNQLVAWNRTAVNTLRAIKEAADAGNWVRVKELTDGAQVLLE